jgi:GNAT superfamily N-acetyltransferase
MPEVVRLGSGIRVYWKYGDGVRDTAVAELDFSESFGSRALWFNRLLVSRPEHRGFGIGSRVMEVVLVWTDFNMYTIFCQANAYESDRQADVERFYTDFGFHKQSRGPWKGLFIRHAQLH